MTALTSTKRVAGLGWNEKSRVAFDLDGHGKDCHRGQQDLLLPQKRTG
jgi:hypothetical protein